jgi:secretion/DNA translocation related TadE-like protein
MRSRACGDDGVVAVVAVALSLLLVAALGAGSVVADVLAARQRAAAAADLGALAAAPAAAWSERSACAAAESVVRANGAVLLECRIRDGDVWVTASSLPRSRGARWLADELLGGTGPRVSARAGMR